LLGERQLPERLVIHEREAAAVDRVAQRNVDPFEVDLGAHDAAVGHAGKPTLVCDTEFDIPDLGAVPPDAVSHLADVVHPVVVSGPGTSQLTLPAGSSLAHPIRDRSVTAMPCSAENLSRAPPHPAIASASVKATNARDAVRRRDVAAFVLVLDWFAIAPRGASKNGGISW
jgi:hypothetical protein